MSTSIQVYSWRIHYYELRTVRCNISYMIHWLSFFYRWYAISTRWSSKSHLAIDISENHWTSRQYETQTRTMQYYVTLGELKNFFNAQQTIHYLHLIASPNESTHVVQSGNVNLRWTMIRHFILSMIVSNKRLIRSFKWKSIFNRDLFWKQSNAIEQLRPFLLNKILVEQHVYQSKSNYNVICRYDWII
jgi:hypothetical protein